MPTTFPMTNPWLDGEELTAAVMYNRITTPINDLAAGTQPIGMQVGRTTTLSVADSTFTSPSSYDAGFVYKVGDLTYSAGVITVVTAGLYLWLFTCTWPSTTATHNRQYKLLQNGADAPLNSGRTGWSFGVASSGMTLTGGGYVKCAAGDTHQMTIWQTSGSTITTSPNTFTMVRVS